MASAQDDGYTSETGSNGSALIYANKICKEVICNYTFCKKLTGITIFSDISKIILTDSVTIYYDTVGNITKRVREITRKKSSTLIDSFYYDPLNRLAQIVTTSIVNGQEIDLGYTIYTYTSKGKKATVNTAYILSNGLVKSSNDQYKYNDYNQLVEIWKESNISNRVLSERYFYNNKRKIKKVENFYADYTTYYRHRKHSILMYSTNEYEYYHRTLLKFNKHHLCFKKVHGDVIEEYFYNNDETLAETKTRYEDNMVSITQHQYYKFEDAQTEKEKEK